MQHRVRAIVDSHPEAYHRPPIDGEWYDSKTQLRQRLDVFAITNGFATAVKSSTHQYIVVQCVHHDSESRNYHKLEEHVEKDQAGRIISRRQRETARTQNKNCQWKITGHIHNDTRWRIKVKCLDHNHPPRPDPLSYPYNKRLSKDHQDAIAIARTHLQAGISHGLSNRILSQQGLSLSNKEYYNLNRSLTKGTVGSLPPVQPQHVPRGQTSPPRSRTVMDADMAANPPVPNLSQPTAAPDLPTLNPVQPTPTSDPETMTIRAKFDQSMDQVGNIAVALAPEIATSFMIRFIYAAEQLVKYAQEQEQLKIDARTPDRRRESTNSDIQSKRTKR